MRLSADGIPFVFHDDETTRLTGVKGSIEARRAAEIDTLRVSNTPIPTLESLCTHLNGYTSPLTINVELKPTGDPAPLIKACAPILSPLQKGLHRLIVSSFDPRVLAAALDAEVPWRLAFLYETLDALPLLNFLDTRAALDLHPMHSLVDAEHLARYETSPSTGPPGLPHLDRRRPRRGAAPPRLGDRRHHHQHPTGPRGDLERPMSTVNESKSMTTYLCANCGHRFQHEGEKPERCPSCLRTSGLVRQDALEGEGRGGLGAKHYALIILLGLGALALAYGWAPRAHKILRRRALRRPSHRRQRQSQRP